MPRGSRPQSARLDKDSETTITALNNLAFVLQAEGKLAEAETADDAMRWSAAGACWGKITAERCDDQ